MLPHPYFVRVSALRAPVWSQLDDLTNYHRLARRVADIGAIMDQAIITISENITW